MMARYAEHTEVASDRSRAEIERTLRRYGASAFAYGWDALCATVMFELADRRIRFRLPMPDRNDRAFTHTAGRGIRRSEDAIDREWEQAQRQRWRALALVIKAKLEAVAAQITTVEQEFLAHIVLPDGSTVGDWAQPQLAIAYERNEMPALMPGSDK
jgi:hypothetical protein